MKVPPFSKYLENFIQVSFGKHLEEHFFYLNQMGSLAVIE